MKKFLTVLAVLFTILHLHSQTSHPKLVPQYISYTQVNTSSGAMSSGTRVVGYQYGDKYIPNSRKSRAELKKIIQLEPEAYHQYKQANVCSWVGTPLLIVGFVGGILGFRYAFGDNPTKVPMIAGATVAIAGLVLQVRARNLSLKCIDTFNAHATTDSENKDGSFGFMFGMNYNPVLHRTYPAFVFKF